MASILYNVANPTDEQVSMTLETVRASAADLQAQGLVDTVVADSDNPYRTAADLRKSIIEGLEKQQGKSPRRLRAETDKQLTPKMIGRSRK